MVFSRISVKDGVCARKQASTKNMGSIVVWKDMEINWTFRRRKEIRAYLMEPQEMSYLRWHKKKWSRKRFRKAKKKVKSGFEILNCDRTRQQNGTRQ